MSEAIIIALISASVTLLLYGGKTVDWMVTRWEKRREAQVIQAKRQEDQTEARKTTRVLLETIELQKQELAMKDNVIAMKDGVIADLLRLVEAGQAGSRQ